MICSVTQQVQNKVDLEKIRDLGHDLMVFHKETFPWAMIFPAVHTMCAHYWKLYHMNDGDPIAVYSEQSGEHWNKHIRNFKSGAGCKTRQQNIEVNTRDIFVRIFLRSHSSIALKRRVLKCSRCNLFGHTVRSCKSTMQSCATYERFQIASCYKN